MKLKIYYEDNHILAVEKPSGMLSQKDISGKPSLLEITKSYIKKKYQKKGNVFMGLVHRLDKPVSGIMIFARTSKAASRLHNEFKAGKVLKFYIAITGRINMNNNDLNIWHTLRGHLSREKDISRISDKKGARTKKAELQFIHIVSGQKYSLLLINLLTGRKHQIRAQLSSAGFPVLGDIKYGSTENTNNHSICLHSYSIRFKHPTKDIILNLFSEIPKKFKNKIRIDSAVEKKIRSLIDSETQQNKY